jgi:hypothetical protein
MLQAAFGDGLGLIRSRLRRAFSATQNRHRGITIIEARAVSGAIVELVPK